MKNRIAPLVSGLLCASALTLSAQNFVLDDSSPYSDYTYRTAQDYAVGEVIFNNGTGKATNPYSIDPVSLKETIVTVEGTEVTVYDICAEMFIGPTGSSSYSVTSGFGSLSSDQQTAVRKLFSNTLGDFILAKATNYDSAATIGAAIQLAFWEIAEDNPSGVTTASLNEDFATPGLLAVDGFTAGPPSYTGTTRDAIDLAETYLANLRNDTWIDEGGLNYFYADGGSEQDRLWVTVGVTALPEPSTAMFGFLGMALMLRRRRTS